MHRRSTKDYGRQLFDIPSVCEPDRNGVVCGVVFLARGSACTRSTLLDVHQTVFFFVVLLQTEHVLPVLALTSRLRGFDWYRRQGRTGSAGTSAAVVLSFVLRRHRPTEGVSVRTHVTKTTV